MKYIIRLILPSILLLIACGDSDSTLNDPGGGQGVDPDGENLVRFEIYTTENDGSERLRWIGNGDGPDLSSPEQTQQPWVGYGRKFRVNFVMKSLDTAVVGYQVRFGECVDQCDYWPVDGVGEPSFEAPNDWVFDPQQLLADAPAGCLEDPECAPGVFLPSGELIFAIRAIDNELNVIIRDRGSLGIQINYPPSVELQEDGGEICDDETLFPHYVFEPFGGGPAEICSIAPGDTIPVGAIVHTKLLGEDRLEGTSPDGSFCCDERADLATPEMRYQGRLEFVPEQDRGATDLLNTFFSPLAEAGEHVFRAGPFDYSYVGRGRDEHGRSSEEDPVFSFVAGYPPRLSSIEPSEGALIVLRDPSAGTPWPDNEFAYRVVSEQLRYWDSDGRRFLETNPSGDLFSISGSLFYLEPRWEGAADPRSPRAASDGVPAQFSGGVLAWAYEWFSQADPENLRSDGPGGDDLGRFDSPPTLNQWDTGADGGFELFVPDLIWSQPELFDCSDPSPLCEMGDYLRARMGEITLLVRGRSTSTTAEFLQCSPGESETSNCVFFSLERRGRYTDTVQRHFVWQLGLDPDGDQQYEAWPPIAALPKRASLDDEALRQRISRRRR